MKIAVIGSGISGLTSAYLLSKEHDISMYEANDYLGGHTNTVDVEQNGVNFKVDTGFIVFNDRTYPLFNKLLAEIGQPFQDSEMSFSVRNTETGLEYNGHSLNTLFSQRKNLISPRFYGLLAEIARFNKEATQLYQGDELQHRTLDEFLQQSGYSHLFSQHYLLPMVAAIWSCSLRDALAFPMRFFVQFFYHHGLLSVTGRPQWHVLKGGSSSYLSALTAPYADQVYLNTPVHCIRRQQGKVSITSHRGEEVYDQVVLACHSDQALALLADATEAESRVLGQMKYQQNDVVLHQDTSVMPRHRRSWASWNFNLQPGDKQFTAPALVTYYMNRLQGLKDAPDFFVTLNGSHLLDDTKVLRRFCYDHPVMDDDMIAAQRQRNQINGQCGTWFCGAYWYNGFHEDGVRSAVDVSRALGIEW